MKNKFLVFIITLFCTSPLASAMEIISIKDQTEKVATGTICFTQENSAGYCGRILRQTSSIFLGKKITRSQLCVMVTGIMALNLTLSSEEIKAQIRYAIRHAPELIKNMQYHNIDPYTFFKEQLSNQNQGPKPFLFALPIELFNHKKQNDIIIFQCGLNTVELLFKGTPEELTERKKNFAHTPRVFTHNDTDIQQLINKQLITRNHNQLAHGPRYRKNFIYHDNKKTLRLCKRASSFSV